MARRRKWGPSHNTHSSFDSVGRCEVHDKIIYRTVKAAKRATRNLTEKHMSVYPCEVTNMWHSGHLADVVIAGEATRDTIYNLSVRNGMTEENKPTGFLRMDHPLEITGRDALADQRSRNICRNCGELGHFTQDCTVYGPLYHEDGKTAADYAELDKEILNKIAAQIVEEHDEPVATDPSLG